MTGKKGIIPQFAYDKCMACGICTSACPISVLVLSKTDVDRYKKAYPVLADDCLSCKSCEKACPFEAVVVC